jgi:hypothetical protein
MSRLACSRILDLLVLGHVAHGGGDEGAFVSVDGGQRDVGREGGGIAAAPGQLAPRAHRPGLGIGLIPGPVAEMGAPDRIRDQHLHRLADQLIPPVAEQPFCLRIDQRNPAVGPDAHHRVRVRLQQPAEPGLSPLPLGHIPGHGRHPDDRPAPVSDGTHRQ